MTQTQKRLNDYCAKVAPKEDSCKNKKRGNCAGDWEPQILNNKWCCIDPKYPSEHCCCPIPQ